MEVEEEIGINPTNESIEPENKTIDSDIGSQLGDGSFSALTTERNLDEFDEDGASQLSANSDTGWDTDLEIEGTVKMISQLGSSIRISIDEKKVYDHTGCDTYTRVCKALGIIPATHFIRCLQAEESTIDLTHHYLGPKGTKALSIALTVGKLNNMNMNNSQWYSSTYKHVCNCDLQ